jgi:predicted glycosyltransferase
LPRDIAHFWKKHAEYREKPINGTTVASHKEKEGGAVANSNGKKVWIDLDNSPHVPFFNPIIEELKQCEHQAIVTARDCSQTCELADLFKLQYKRIGRHYGKNKIMKIIGTINRALQLIPVIAKEKPDLAVSHGSRSQMLAAWILRIPFILIADYEHVRWLPLINPSKIIIPEVIPKSSIKFNPRNVIKYPGIKEDVYVPDFQPDYSIMEELGLNKDHLVVTIRPPATEAHYHNAESEELFKSLLGFLLKKPKTRLVILPRNKNQEISIKDQYLKWFKENRIIIPNKAVDGLNLIWHSDLIISGGGTMNREAAALKVPVYSIFRGQIGAVDRFLSESDRLTLIKNVEEIKLKLKLEKRNKDIALKTKSRSTLNCIVEHILKEIRC